MGRSQIAESSNAACHPGPRQILALLRLNRQGLPTLTIAQANHIPFREAMRLLDSLEQSGEVVVSKRAGDDSVYRIAS